MVYVNFVLVACILILLIKMYGDTTKETQIDVKLDSEDLRVIGKEISFYRKLPVNQLHGYNSAEVNSLKNKIGILKTAAQDLDIKNEKLNEGLESANQYYHSAEKELYDLRGKLRYALGGKTRYKNLYNRERELQGKSFEYHGVKVPEKKMTEIVI